MENYNGIILIDKPAFVTSHDIVNTVRKILHTKRVGHTGTLDPIATGVLPVCVGSATKAAEMLTCDSKSYTAQLVLGMTTDTADCEGEVLTDCSVTASEDEIKKAVLSLKGELMQIPPMYSAKKQDGKKLYELARMGVTVDRKPVPVTVHDISVLDVDMTECTVSFHVNCSKGTYVRSLCEEIGIRLKCGAYMNTLRRTSSGEFDINDCITVENLKEICEKGELENILIPVDSIFDYKKVILPKKQAERFKNGVFVSNPHISDGNRYRVYDNEGNFMALADCIDSRLKTYKSFRT